LHVLSQAGIPLCVYQPDETHANRTASVLDDIRDTEHTTSGSDEEEAVWVTIVYF